FDRERLEHRPQLLDLSRVAGREYDSHTCARSVRVQGFELPREQLADAVGREVQQLVELMAAQGVAFGRALHFDEAAAVVHHDIHVGFGVRVLGVVEIEHRHARPDTDGHRGDLAVNRALAQCAFTYERVDGVDECNVTSGDGCGARAAVR